MLDEELLRNAALEAELHSAKARIAELEAERDQAQANNITSALLQAGYLDRADRAERWAARWKKAAKRYRGKAIEAFDVGYYAQHDETSRALSRAEAAEARERVLRAAVVEYIHEHGLEHKVDCPEDNTCDCALVQDIEAALAATKEKPWA